ncbi:uncharacterized protein PHA67_004228 isoform 1-T3 [Liasis olivaceus]
MLGSSAGCQGTGAQPGVLPFVQRRVLCPPAISGSVAKRQTWPILFTILALFITAAASKEDHAFLNTVSGTGWPTSRVTNISTEEPTNLGYTQPGQQRTDSAFTRSFHRTGVGQINASQPHTPPPEHADTLSDKGKMTERPYLTSASVNSMGTSLQDFVSPIGTASLGTTEGGSVFLHSISEGVARSPAASKLFKQPTGILPGFTSVPSYVASSRKMLFEQTTTYNEEYDTAQLVATSPPTGVTIPVTQHLSSLWVSPRYSVETIAHVAVPTSTTLTRLESEKTTGVSTGQQLEPLSISFSSHGPISRIIEPCEVFPLSTAIDRSHLDPENSTTIHMGIAFPYEGSDTVPPIHSLVTVVSSSGQQSTADSILQGSQQLEVGFTLPLRNASTGVSFLNHQTSRSSPLSTLLSGSAKTGFRVPLLQTGLLETTANTIDYRKPLKTEYHGRKGQTTAGMKKIPTSKSPFTAVETDSIRELASVQPVDALPKRGTTPLSSTSKESSEPETITDFLVTKVVSLGTEKNDSTLPSLPYLDTVEFLQPIRATSAGMTHTGLLPGGHTTSATVESFDSPFTEQKLASPSQSHATVSLPDLVELDRSLVTPSHGSLSANFTSIPFSRISVPESTLKMYINITEGYLARKGQMVPRTTLPLSATRTATPPSLESSNTMGGVAPFLPTKAPKVGVNTSAVMFDLGSELGYKVTGTSTADALQRIGTTALHIRSSGFTKSKNSEVPAHPSSVLETKSTQATPVFSATTTLLTSLRTLLVESKSTKRTTCENIPCPVSVFTPSQSTSAQVITSSPFLTRKFLITILGTVDPNKNLTPAALDAKVSRSEKRETTVLPRTKTVTGVQHDRASQQPRSKFTTPLLNQSVKNLILSKPISPVPTVHTLSLWFRLIKIQYKHSLKNRSSKSYMKLEKEIKLTLNKMLSTYESFLQTKILHFFNGSVIVESQVVFRAMGPLPTPSDIIRTIVTEVELRGMDAFFDWRMDVKSLYSNGFSLKNLEPENLAISFTLLGLGSTSAFGDKILGEHLESLKIKMKRLLGTRYAVHLISLVDLRNIQGGIGINGNIFIKSDAHVDIGWALKALTGLSNFSVDLISLSINGSRLSLQVFPVSFLVTNRIFNEKMLDRSSVEHQNIAKDLSDTLTRILGKYENLLQVAIRKITGGSLVCHGDVIFQRPAPSNKDVLQTLAFSVGPKDYLDSSSFQVDPFSFTVAGAGLEPSLKKSGVPGYAVALIILCLFALIAVPIFIWLRKVLGRRDKITINGARDIEVDVEAFELDNPGYHATIEEGESNHSCVLMEAVG